MKMTFRWYGDDDPVTLDKIRQIPGIVGIVSAIYDIPVGEAWDEESIFKLKNKIEEKGLELSVIESVPVHEDIKLGRGDRDRYIENYCITLRNLAKAGVDCVCYNFMPVFDWTRSELDYELPDGSNALVYFKEQVDKMDPVSGELDRVIKTAEVVGVKMAIHPDDPPWSIFGLPRIITNKANIERFLKLYDSEYNGLTLCSGSLAANPENDIADMVYTFGKRIHFAHMRNIKITGEKCFEESAHMSECGSLDMVKIMKAYKDIGFDGYMRPDHGRMIWGESGRPGYGLYDRALGSQYLKGIWDTLTR